MGPTPTIAGQDVGHEYGGPQLLASTSMASCEPNHCMYISYSPYDDFSTNLLDMMWGGTCVDVDHLVATSPSSSRPWFAAPGTSMSALVTCLGVCHL